MMGSLLDAFLEILTHEITWGLAVLWLLSAFLLMAAPRWDWCMALVVTPTIWKVLSLGSIPIFFTVPSVRRHLLKRYNQELYLSKDFSGWTNCGGPIASTQSIYAQLAEHRRVRLVGEPLITERYMRYLTWKQATGKVDVGSLRRAVPIFLHLNPHNETKSSLEGRVEDQLKEYGGISDKGVARIFLARGGFMFILLGHPAELSKESIAAVAEFIDGYRNRNLVIVGFTMKPGESAASVQAESLSQTVLEFPPAISLVSSM